MTKRLYLDDNLKIFLDAVCGLLSVEIASVMLLDEDKNELVLKCAKGIDEGIVKDARVRLGEGVSGWIAQTGKPLLVKDIGIDQRFSKRNGKYYTDSFLSVPLKIREKTIGVVNVNNKTTRKSFVDSDLHALELLANVGALILNVQYFNPDSACRASSKIDFISNLSHELRAPLTSIKESVNLVLEGIAGKINDDQTNLLGIATNNINRLHHLIDEILLLARADSKALPMKRRLFDIVGLLERLIVSLGPLGQPNNVVLVSMLPGEEIPVWADPDKMNHVFTNLIDNAVKYNKSKGRVEIGLKKTDKSVMIWIRDSGIGIPSRELERIFNRFHRVEMCAKGKVSGNGIGLSIVKEIVEKHGGQLGVESELGKGTVFTVKLPRDLRKRESSERT